jgi:hypothetical protein
MKILLNQVIKIDYLETRFSVTFQIDLKKKVENSKIATDGYSKMQIFIQTSTTFFRIFRILFAGMVQG